MWLSIHPFTIHLSIYNNHLSTSIHHLSIYLSRHTFSVHLSPLYPLSVMSLTILQFVIYLSAIYLYLSVCLFILLSSIFIIYVSIYIYVSIILSSAIYLHPFFLPLFLSTYHLYLSTHPSIYHLSICLSFIHLSTSISLSSISLLLSICRSICPYIHHPPIYLLS